MSRYISLAYRKNVKLTGCYRKNGYKLMLRWKIK